MRLFELLQFKHRGAKIAIQLLLATVSFNAFHAQAFDLSSCQDSTDRLRRAGRDLADSAGAVSESDVKRDAMSDIFGGIDDVELRLRRMRNDCEHESRRVRICRNI